MSPHVRFIFLFFLLATPVLPGQQTTGWIWWEGEQPEATNFARRTWFDPQNPGEAEVLSEGAWLTNDGQRTGEELFARYRVRVPETGSYALWARKFWKHGPFRWRFDEAPWRECGSDVALADSAPLRRHVGANWVHLGEVELRGGAHRFELRLLAKRGEKATACFDCFLLSRPPFYPRGKLKPDARSGLAAAGWWAFEPAMDAFASSPIDLRELNEKTAGEKGHVRMKDGGFVLGDGRPVRFWSVNCGPEVLRQDERSVDYLARRLAKCGVNLVRCHGALFDRRASDPEALDRELLAKLHYFAAALKRNGIYLMLSFYFPLWFDIKPGYGIDGYEQLERKKPFALLTFDPRMQEIYRAWARGLLTTPNPHTGMPLASDPAVAIVELVNEDSYFFWTFDPKNIPAARLAELERRFATWAAKRHGSLERALAAWKGERLPGDAPGEGRLALRGAWFMTSQGLERGRGGQRIRDQVRFLAEDQRAFYAETIRFMREDLGARCLFSCSNWHTADAHLLDALERWTYTAGDVLDQHGYFGGRHEGPASSYAVNAGDRFAHRSGLLEPQALPIRFNQVQGHAHMISEIGWPEPNRYKCELPLLAAAYGSLQDVDAFCFFAVHGAFWESSLNKFSLSVPSVLGQFPAAALMYRRGDLEVGRPVRHERLVLEKLFDLQGSGAIANPSLDALRAADVPKSKSRGTPGELHPLAFYVGQVTRSFDSGPADLSAALARYVDPAARTIESTSGELHWDYGKGVVTIDSPRSQGALGNLAAAGRIELRDLAIECRNDLACVLAISLDGEPLARSTRVLVQAVTEDRFHGWNADGDRIASLGGLPLNVREIEVALTLARPGKLRSHLTLDANGYPRGKKGVIDRRRRITLAKDALYTLLSD